MISLLKCKISVYSWICADCGKALKSRGIFDVVNGMIVGKPQDEAYYDEYKEILVRVIDNVRLPIVYNVNFGHATPRCVLQYGAMAKVDMKQKKIFVSK